MMTEKLELEPLIQEVNQRLKINQKIHPDDPILATVILNQVILERYVEQLHSKLRESQLEIEAKTRQEIQEAKELAGRMIDNTGGHLEAQLQRVGEAWEAKFREAAALELEKVKASTQLAKIGGYLALLGGAILIALATGKVLLTLWP